MHQTPPVDPVPITTVLSAVALAGPGANIALDSSATSLAVAEMLLDRPRTVVVTTSLEIADVLLTSSAHTVCLVGGELHRATRSMVGNTSPTAGTTISVGFFGGNSYTPTGGLMDRDAAVAAGKGTLAAQCRQIIGIIDEENLGAFGPYTAVPATALTRVLVLRPTAGSAAYSFRSSEESIRR
ncbi:hypothetical protein D1871_15460 [Nakamurella silvestris]|nr:hypothetical protein D1871_15460 [Nakamurella silvestris]